ncbi:putative UTP-glucose-1-phosphate uridylyltransferase [Rhizoclosmatium globosum]|uniref:UTP--glucose-1-phosphate uridylyltransferase n=1 Tax=Rhizoclosmatium globosum TaxID=329046 RepID=A0A1Y2C552_9FUNG|nr:UTP-glucose-1-phosphate uridylyltransferase [Rhizoclosmatium sp. JEL0117]ORY42163.1 putative UTP-glucose-1-phosphate uridylyltransferase [Rhizoclosmatium globosum]|eukprot:ORY42163.1 putative UTP-glucose-1-phosphate uridylyltransferase [Rhizoclosmatium globosum]
MADNKFTSTENMNGAPSAHDRAHSLIDFQGTTLGMAAKGMRNELHNLVNTAPEADREHFAKEMDSFFDLFGRYLTEKAKGQKINWGKIKSPKDDQIIPYKNLKPVASAPVNAENLAKLAVLKLNGGLGTTMGCVGPKSAIEVRDGMTFLDLTVRQVEYLNSSNGVNVPLILMNSFNTDVDTTNIIQKYSSHALQILTFNQSRYPRVGKESLLPCPKSFADQGPNWYPPGHGDLFESLANSGLLDQLIAEGKEYLFISNVDNLGATVDTTILDHMAKSGAEFIMEVTDKTKADIKGGTLIDYDGQVRLLEIAQVPSEYTEEFKSIKKFKIFNTNNLWVSLKAIKRVVSESALSMEIIENIKTSDKGEKVIQLETAVGAAIKHFKGAHGVNVPRSRFLPVKSCSDLFLITSDLYSLNHGVLNMNPKRHFQQVPIVKLGDHFKKVNQYLGRFKSPPHILELDHLTVTGDVTFGSDVQLRGTVIIVANHGERIDIPSGAILDDKVVSGNLRILDH